MKTSWEDILLNNRNNKELSLYRELCLNNLQQAAKDGLCCLNPPDEKEIFDIISHWFFVMKEDSDIITHSDMHDLAKAISKRIEVEANQIKMELTI